MCVHKLLNEVDDDDVNHFSPHTKASKGKHTTAASAAAAGTSAKGMMDRV